MPYNSDGVGYRPIDTSEAASVDASAKAPFYRLMVMQDLSLTGPSTADEIAERLKLSPLTVRPRVSELRNSGSIYDTGIRRKNVSGKTAAVWAVSKERKNAE